MASMDRKNVFIITEDLGKEDVAAMKFLCFDLISRNKQETITDGKGLIVELQYASLVEEGDYFFIAELLYLIGQFKLLRKLNLTKQEVENKLQDRTVAKVSPYRKLLYELSEEINTEDLRGMKFILDNKLKKSTLEKESVFDIFTEMEKKEMLSESKLRELKDILRPVSCVLVKKIEDYERKLQGGLQQTSILDSNLSQMTLSDKKQDPPRNQEGSQGSTEGQSAEEYTMSSRPHGYCLIINNFNFENTELGNRHGTDIDASALKEVFEWLGFEVRKADDVTGAGMHGILKEYQSKPHTDCFVCCILSHGEQECVLGTDGDKVYIRDLVSYFNGQNCPSLLTKPKVFFIQACQGKTNQQSVQVDGDEPGSAALESDALATPFDADRLIGMATVQDCLSFRSKQKGSWYIQALCKHLKQSCPSGEDIHAILTKVNNDVSKEQGYIRDKLMKQMPEPRHTLTKKLVFRVPVNSQP
ncbi:caspase-8-like [Huso huso]|uniref:Caspase-8-like n=1 Tax=Huso huso TaxID=61971 RepID=A0ABR0ZK14_HUSHU